MRHKMLSHPGEQIQSGVAGIGGAVHPPMPCKAPHGAREVNEDYSERGVRR